MSVEHFTLEDPRIQGALTELQSIIKKHFPQATFEVSEGDDPCGIYLTATVDVDNLTTIIDVFSDRLVDIQVEEGLPVHVILVQPLEQVMEELRRERGLA